MVNHEIGNYFHQEKKEQFITHRMVVKIGSSTIIEGGAGFIDDIARQGSILFHCGVKIAIVGSGAVGTGNLLVRNYHNLDTTLDKQTSAFFGQSKLIKEWVNAFERYDVLAGELLIAEDHLGKANNLLIRAMDFGIPIINGYDAMNDNNNAAISSDNDKLTAFVSRTINADTAVFLTDINGLMDTDGELINFVDRLEDIQECIQKGSGTGGMWGKCIEAHYLAREGQRSIITNGKARDVLLRIARGENLGTRFGKGWMLY